MHATLIALQEQLNKIVSQLQKQIPSDDPFGIAHNNWSFPGLTRVELIEAAQAITTLIEEQGSDHIGDSGERLKDYLRRLEHLRNQTIPHLWGNAGQAVSAYMLTLQGLRKALEPALKRDQHPDNMVAIRKVATQLRGMEARLKDLQPRTTALASMVERIEEAYNAADQLPADLESLAEAQQKIQDTLKDAAKDQSRLAGIREAADEFDRRLRKSAEEAEAVLSRCETAYSAATSVGLAAAFTERSRALAWSMWLWVFGLIGALVAGGYFGSQQLRSLSELAELQDAATSIVILNLLLSLFSVAAPVWFAWLATKQIGQRFRLAEDYAFKASVSRAYEGYRREAARVDKDMEARLLASALTRLDELPLRLVEADSHGSPWHELASSDIVKQAMRAVPGFAEQVKSLASEATNKLMPSRARMSGSGE